ncbi:MAG: two-component regulator propeller domain-containing protein, partial [Verrucomicrobiota bacterium]
LVRFDGANFKRVPLAGPAAYGLVRGLSLLHKDELWVTVAGRVAVRLKGTETNVYTKYEGMSEFRSSLVSPKAAVEGSEGSAWIGFNDGFAYQIENGQISCFSTNEGLTGIGYCLLANDSKGQLWFANSGRVGVFRDGRFVPLLTVASGPLCIASARQSGIWICTGTQLLWYNGTGVPKVRVELPTGSSVVDPTALFEDRHGAVWIGTAADGLFRYDGSNAIVRVEVSHNNILSLAEDAEGDIWVGTAGGGLNQVRPRVLELEGNSTRLPHEAVRSMCQDTSGALWVIGQDGDLSRQQKNGWHILSARDGWTGGSAICLARDLQGAVWIGTALNGLYRWQDGVFTHLGTNEGLASMIISSLLADSKGNLWVALERESSVQKIHDGVLTRFDQPEGDFPVSAMVEDAAGTIWMATSGARLMRVNGDAIVDESSRVLSPPIFILCLHTTSDGSLWIGYAGAGVGRLKNGKFALIGTAQGLLDNQINGIANDDYGNLWFNSDRGIFKVRQRELDAVAEGRDQQVLPTAYGRNQSLPNLQANHAFAPASIRTSEGHILFPTDSGLAIVHPKQAHPIPFVAPVLIERLVVDGRNVNIDPSSPEPQLPPDHWNVELEFSALSFASPENVRFRYRLVGWNEDWQETRMQRSASYTRLPAGQYTFEVTACTDFGIWRNPPVALRFRVRPFFWQTWWFRVLSVSALVSLGAAWASQRKRRKHRAEVERLERLTVIERERTRVAQDLHDDLGAGLTEIGLAASLAQRPNTAPERIQNNLRQVADKSKEMVAALDEIVWAVNPRHDTVVSLTHYLCDYAQQFLNLSGIRCRLEVASDPPVSAIGSEQRHNLFLAFKESLTNVARHSHATEVQIRFRSQADGNGIIEIEDNGHGVTSTPGSGVLANGLSNMSRRLEQIGGRCEIHCVPTGGTMVRFIYPCAAAGMPLNKPLI